MNDRCILKKYMFTVYWIWKPFFPENSEKKRIRRKWVEQKEQADKENNSEIKIVRLL